MKAERERRVEAPYLQLVLERLWEVERRARIRRAPRLDAGRARRCRADRRGAPRARTRGARRRRARSRRASLQLPRDAVRDEDLARRGRPRALRGRGSEPARAGARRARCGSHPPPRPWQERGPAPVRDLPRRSRAGRPRVAHAARGRTGTGAGARGGEASSPADRRGRGRRARRARGNDGTRRVGVVAASRGAGEGARCGRRRAGCEGARARGERDRAAGHRPRARVAAGDATQPAWRRRPRPRTCSGGRCASPACARWRTWDPRSAISLRCPAARSPPSSSTAACGSSKGERPAASSSQPRRGAQTWLSGEQALTVRGTTLTVRSLPRGNVIATVPVPSDTRFAASGPRVPQIHRRGQARGERHRRRGPVACDRCRIPRACTARRSARTGC